MTGRPKRFREPLRAHNDSMASLLTSRSEPYPLVRLESPALVSILSDHAVSAMFRKSSDPPYMNTLKCSSYRKYLLSMACSYYTEYQQHKSWSQPARLSKFQSMPPPRTLHALGRYALS